MSERRPEPFVLALTELRGRLRRGEAPLDMRLAASDIAADLGLSATPVREALSRLAGEGLLEDRRGEGFFVRRLGRVDVAALYRLSLTHLIMALEVRGEDGEAVEAAHADLAAGHDPVEATERLFARWAAGGGRAVALSFARVQGQLAAARRLEPRLIEDLQREAESLALTGDRPEQLRRLRAFFNRRVRLADRLADLLDRESGRHTL